MATKKTAAKEPAKATEKRVIPTDQLELEGVKYQFKAYAFHSVLTPSKKVIVKDLLADSEKYADEIAALLATEGQQILVEV